MLILVDSITNRIEYVFDFIFGNQQINYSFTSDIAEFTNCKTEKFVYATQETASVFKIPCTNLLYEEGITQISIETGEYQNETCFSFNGIVDPIASIFYVLSRMEEYQNELKYDKHKRFQAKQSLQYQFNCLEQLICERLAKVVIDQLHTQQIIQQAYQKQALNCCPSFDIDNSYAYLHKGFIRSQLAKFKDLFKGNQKRLQERKLVFNGTKKDPFDTYDRIFEIAQSFQTHVFILLGKLGKYDRNSPPKSKQQQFIRLIDEKCTLGIHPSYASNEQTKKLTAEITSLEKILSRPIKHSRQHFLRLNFPKSYQELIKHGIEHDFSMGFAEEVGFRSGTLRAHRWFDLSSNQITNLWIHPFAYMDGTLHDYKNWSSNYAIQKIHQLIQEASLFGGDFYFIWHNETIGNHGRWEGWSEVLDETLNQFQTSILNNK